MTNDYGQYMARRQEEREQEKRIYAELKRNLLNSENIIEATEGQMPISKPFYTFQVTMGWVRQRVHLVGEMTMFNIQTSVTLMEILRSHQTQLIL